MTRTTIIPITILGLAMSVGCGTGTVGDSGFGPESDPQFTSPSASTASEICGNGLDDDGNFKVDENCTCTPGTTQPCYPGPSATKDVAACKAGTQTCETHDEFSSWGECVGATLPSMDICGDGNDQDCNGTPDDGPGCSQTGGSGTDPGSNPGGNPGGDPGGNGGVPPCGPDNCNGCCDSAGKCQETQNADHCGLSGTACDTCQLDELCKAAVGRCEPKPPEMWEVVAISANVKKSCEGIFSFINDCDPYVKVTIGSHSGRSKTDKGDDTPTWNSVLFAIPHDELEGKTMKVTVMDDDSFLFFSDDKIADCSFTVTAAVLAKGQMINDCGSKVSDLRFDFRPKN